ncbi:MAG: hypothetical protein FJ276_05250, partial [Planctomycetes bacterium]|nr:hypothetical protein [Planctomycetota bacterium]
MSREQLEAAPVSHFGLARCLENHAGFAEALVELAAGRLATFDGVVGSSCALLAARLLDHAPGPLVVVCLSEDAADVFCDDLRLFVAGEAMRLPAWESDPGERILHDEVFGERLRTLKRLHGWSDRAPASPAPASPAPASPAPASPATASPATASPATASPATASPATASPATASPATASPA